MTANLSAAAIRDLITADRRVPSEATVHAQSISFYPRQWRNSWPEHLQVNSTPILNLDDLDEKGRRTIDRSDLFSLGSKVETPADALNFFVAVYSWGVGTYARGVSRGLRVLEDKDAGKKILSALGTLRESDFDPRVGYAALNSYDQEKIKYLGPAFFTKLLYFYSHGRMSRRTNTPLILDQYVARSLGCRSWGWTSAQYAEYILVVDEARALLEDNISSDVVEYVLFDRGRRNADDV